MTHRTAWLPRECHPPPFYLSDCIMMTATRIVQMTMGTELIARVDQFVKRLGTTRSTFTGMALRAAPERCEEELVALSLRWNSRLTLTAGNRPCYISWRGGVHRCRP